MPVGNTGGMVMDFWQRAMTDLGQAGPDKGKGGKYLLIGPGQGAPKRPGYWAVPVTTNNFFAGIRVLDPGEPASCRKKRIPRLSLFQRANPPAQKSRAVDGKTWSQVQPRGIEYWERYNEYMQQEPVHERDRMMTAMLAPWVWRRASRSHPPSGRRSCSPTARSSASLCR